MTCVPQKHPDGATAWPGVVPNDDTYRMWFSYRGGSGYCEDHSQGSRLRYAESSDGIVWQRRDDEAGLERSKQGWDSYMVRYPSVYEHAGRRYLVYNGNGFRRSGPCHVAEEG